MSLGKMDKPDLTIDEKYDLITRNLQEVLGESEIIKKIMAVRSLKIYWGTAPTGKPHIGYFVQFLKIADYLKAGCEVKILIADIHAYLDNLKSELKQLDARTRYYTILIQTVLESCFGLDISKLSFVKGSDYQLKPEYTFDVYKINSLCTVKIAQHAGAEVVKQTDNPKMTGLLYPTLQVLDEQYLDVDIETCGIDQRKILTFGRNMLPKIGYNKKRFHFMTPMVPGMRFEKKDLDKNLDKNLDKDKDLDLDEIKSDINNLISNIKDKGELLTKLEELIEQKKEKSNIQLEKMSSSNEDSKIDLLDTKKNIFKKINKAYCFPGDIEDNSLLTIVKMILFPILDLKGIPFVIDRPDKYGGKIVYDKYEKLEEDFKNEVLHPGDFKMGIADNFSNILEPVRKKFEDKELQKLVKLAYD